MTDVERVFTKFPNLPLEIRLVIWELALAALPSSIVEIRQKLEGHC
jgi:hypothetical protein